MPPVQGTPVSTETGLAQIRTGLNAALGEANLKDFALGFWRRTHLGKVGKFRACWSAVKLSGMAVTVDVPHNVGQPSFCVLVDLEYAENIGTVPHVTYQQVKRSKWTATTCRMDVRVVVGSLDNVIGWFIVGGE